MAKYNTYIQQLHFDGTTYMKGSVVDLLDKFKLVAMDFPFKKNPKPKDLPTRDWAGSDGVDVYVPDQIPMKEYEIEVTFLYVGTELSIRTDISNFIDFIYGRSKGAIADIVKSGRLAVYNEYTGLGRKDIVVSHVEPDLFEVSDDPDAIAKFNVKFMVYDPTTEVTATYGTYNGVERLTGLNF